MVSVLRFADANPDELGHLLAHYGLSLTLLDDGTEIPGSYWGDEEAGLIGESLYLRADTPVHSLLHEACHYVCMDAGRRQALHTDAGGDDAEENAVCYLQMLLAKNIAQWGLEGIQRDMDAWGYSFRLGSSSAWFEQDADDARRWLRQHDLIDDNDQPTFNLRA